MKKIWILISLLIIFSVIIDKPTNSKIWNTEGKILAEIDIGTSTVKIFNVKNFSYGKTEQEVNPSYYNKIYPLYKVKNIYFNVNPFWGYKFAHTYLTFEFENSEKLSVSVEARKTEGQSYHPILGFFNFYNLYYMFVDENDITTLRTVVRNDKLYSYRLKLSTEEKNKLFLEILQRGVDTYENPEFYNTLLSSCTTNVFDSINKILEKKSRISFDWKIIFPEDSAKIFYDKKMLDIDYKLFPTYESLKEVSNIQDMVRKKVTRS